MKTEIIRAFLLEVGDRFLMYEREYQVKKITKTHIHYGIIDGDGTCHIYDRYTMGVDSRQRIELICPLKTNQK